MEDLFMTISAAALPNMADSKDPFPYYGFKNTSELSSNGLYNFFCCFCDQMELKEYWNEQDQKYHIPIQFVRNTLDCYFEGYHFDPRKITYHCGYQADKQVFEASGIPGFDLRKDGVDFCSVTQTAKGDICIKAKQWDLYDADVDTVIMETLILHPTNTGYLFTSYHIDLPQYTDEELFDFSESLGFKIVNWIAQPPRSSIVINHQIAQLECEFDLSNYYYMRIAIDNGLSISGIPNTEVGSVEKVDIKGVSVTIRHSSSESVEACWTKNGYAFCLYMKDGIKEIPEKSFIREMVEYFSEEIQLDPDHAA